MEAYTYELKVPKERVAVIIGKDGEVKKRIESETESTLRIDSKEGDIFVTGEDALKLYTAREIITAVSRGFNPEIAETLLKPDYALEVIPINDYARTKQDLLRLKGRVIGADGKSRRLIEQLTETDICVYGKTVSIIGEASQVSLARRAIISLLQGSLHSKVYQWLEKQRKTHRATPWGSQENTLE